MEFDDDTALETLLLADDLWSELHEFASLYDVQDDLKHLTEVYSPKKTKSPSPGTITLSDVFNVVKPMGNVTVNKSIAKTKSVTQKKVSTRSGRIDDFSHFSYVKSKEPFKRSHEHLLYTTANVLVIYRQVMIFGQILVFPPPMKDA